MQLESEQRTAEVRSTKRVTVRRSVLSDIPWVIEQARKFGEVINRDIEIIGRSDLWLAKCIADAINDVAFTACCGDKLVGCIGGRLFPQPFNPLVMMLMEMFWWVPEEYRKTRAGYLLLKKFCEVGNERADATVLTLQNSTPVIERTVERLGFKLYERSFAKINNPKSENGG